jgi:hypothetical protein
LTDFLVALAKLIPPIDTEVTNPTIRKRSYRQPVAGGPAALIAGSYLDDVTTHLMPNRPGKGDPPVSAP